MIIIFIDRTPSSVTQVTWGKIRPADAIDLMAGVDKPRVGGLLNPARARIAFLARNQPNLGKFGLLTRGKRRVRQWSILTRILFWAWS
jgi:hypothetical protein